MVAPSSMTTRSPITTWGSMTTSLPIARVVAEKDRLGRYQRRAIGHDRGAEALLHDGFGLGELGARVHAEHLFAIRLDHARFEPVAAGERHGVGEIEFLLGVVVADPSEQTEQGLARAETHDAGIAERERALLRACVLLFADAGEPSPVVEQEPAIAGRVLGLEADHHEIGAGLELGADLADASPAATAACRRKGSGPDPESPRRRAARP